MSPAPPLTRLVVCRTRAHQRAALREARHDVLVWTYDDLWDRLASWACLRTGLVRDDLGTRLLAAAVLADVGEGGGAALPRLTPALDAFRRELVGCGLDAAALEAAVVAGDEPSARRTDLARLLRLLLAVERGLGERGVVDDVLARREALGLLHRGHWPHALGEVTSLTLWHPVDLPPLDVELVLALARRVAVRVVLPVDDAPGRALVVGSERLFARLERASDGAAEPDLGVVGDGVVGDGPLAPLRAALFTTGVVGDAPASVVLAADVEEEARLAVGVVAAFHTAHPGARIAIAARRTALLDPTVRALERDGLAVRRRRRALHESPAARLLLDMAALRTDGIPRDRLLAVLLNPARRGAIHPDEAAHLLTTLRKAAARRDHEDATRPAGGYRRRLEQLQRRDPRLGADVAAALRAIEPVMALAATLPLRARLVGHLEAWLALARVVVDDARALGGAEVFEIIARLVAGARRVGDPQASIELHALARLVEVELERQPWLDDEVDVDDRAVEATTIPELAGRSFDLVVIVGAVEQELPQPTRQTSSLLGDADRAWLNRRLGRQALATDAAAHDVSPEEMLWWLLALRSAQHALVVMAPRREARGRELAPSSYLLDLARALGTSPAALLLAGTAGAPLTVRRDRRRRQLARAISDADAPPPDTPVIGSPGDVLRRARTMARERQRWFDRSDAPFSERRAPFAFAVDDKRIARAFGHAFGLDEARPLTPTRLEALAECRLHGFVQHVLKLDVDPEPGNAIEARVAGTFAHTVLERFYKDRATHGVRVDRFTDADRARLGALIDEETTRALQVASGHHAALAAALRFMRATLIRVVAAVSARPPVEGVEPCDFELQVGTRAGGRAADLPPVPIDIGDGRRIWLGGVIDRVDEGPGARAVVDYKTMSAARVREKAAPATLFERHFQLLIYLRLLEAHRPTPATTSLHGYLLSLKDGATSPDIGATPELRARVLDDSRDDSLGQAIGRVILPVLQGTLPPDAGVRCDTCRLQRVCRVPLEGPFEPDPDERDDEGAPP
jgi:RecB family exonuclease